ncbi:hypothetical protein AAF712_004255 [Marasmius tenuissimus]|uniref:Uncharacterized protein n=1 Tax=Marasmius tenuissimus TaxID=585030 RepID=A0ABR3A3H5_9AGAR
MDPKKRPHSRSPSPAAKRATPANLLSRNRDSTSSSVSSSQNQRGLQEPGRMQGKRSRTNTSSFRGGSSSNSRRVTQSGYAQDVRDLGGVDPLRNELTVVKRRLEETEDELNQQNKNVMMLLREKAEAEKRHIKTVEDLERRIEALESQCKGDVGEEEEVMPFGPIYISSSESENEDADQGDHSDDSDREEPTEARRQHEDAAQPTEDSSKRTEYIGKPKEGSLV